MRRRGGVGATLRGGKTASQVPRRCRCDAERRKNRLSGAAAESVRRWEAEKPPLRCRGGVGATL